MNRIVVIEDDPAILRGLSDNLRLQSYDVFTAADGEDGYRLVRQENPDMVILDLTLPGMNGFEVCRRIRRDGIATPVLMLTAQDQETNRVEGFDAGADDYVTKPFSLRELLGRVRAILKRSEGRADLANQKELDEARRIQERLMPGALPEFPGLRVSGAWRPARIVGGDYYDVLQFDDATMGVCIADVCGKGMPAAMMMANLQASVKASASKETSPRELCETLNRVMCVNLASHGFISFFYARIDSMPDGGKRLTYCNAGHNPPILFGNAAAPRRLDCGGGILGVFDSWHYEEKDVFLNAGDRVLMYTDGITESRNAAGEEFGEDRLIDVVRRLQRDTHTDAEAMTEEVIAAATRFSNGNFEDDLTVAAISVD